MLGVGVVGCGAIGGRRAGQLPHGLQLAACYDVDRARAEELTRTAGTPSTAVASSVEELLDDPAVQLVIVATVHEALAAVALRAVEAGRHVLVEKPGAVSAAELRAVRDVAVARGVCARVGFNHRFHPAILQLLEAVRGGAFGGLLFVRARYGHGGRVGYEREWRADRNVSGGGELIDQGSHLIDLTRFLFGDAELAFAELRTAFWPMDVEDNAFVALRPRSGGFAWLHASWTEWKNMFSYEVMLERAKLEVTGLGGSYGPERLVVHEMQPEMGPPPSWCREWPGDDLSWQRELADMAAAIAGEPSIGATLDDAMATLSLIEQAYTP